MKNITFIRKATLAVIGSGVALAIAGGEPAVAQVTVNPQLFTDVTTGQTLANPPYTLGWEFVANNSITVNALGFFDDSQDGLAESHLVGLWDSQGNLIAETTVTTTDLLVNQWRYSGITPVTLTAGSDYYVGALYTSGADNVVFPGYSGAWTTPNITYLGATYAESAPDLADPTVPFDHNGFFGPNISAVPELSSWVMMLVGFAGLGFAGYRSSRKNVSAV
jgi:hypothetical protein